ncbi:hypothetical protein ACF1DY_15030 [Streptomyces albus]
MAGSFDPHPPHRPEPLIHSTKRAALVRPGDVIGYEGLWRTVGAVRTALGPLGGLAIVVAWEEGGSGRFPAGDEVLVAEPPPADASG